VRHRILCVISTVAVALSVSGCFRDSYVSTASIARSGNWKIDQKIDRVTGAPISSAFTTAMASNATEAFPQLATLQLSCFINSPVISFRFDSKVGSERNSFLGYRFDEKPGHETSARFVATANTIIIEDDAEVAEFVRELATSQVLYVRSRSFNAGRTAAEFKVDGAPAAIASAFATCPVKQAAPSQRVATQNQRKRSQ
jgi:hypothetical protein